MTTPQVDSRLAQPLAGIPGVQLSPLPPDMGIGVRVKETDTHFIDVVMQIVNWRVCSTPKDDPVGYDGAYCYYGRDQGSYVRAVLGAAAWDGPGHSDPPGWQKDALTGRYADREVAS